MCLAIPGRVESWDEEQGIKMAWIDYGGMRRRVCLEYTPEAVPGDYVIVHAGFAISVLDHQSAKESLDVLHQLAEAQRGLEA